MRLIILYFLVNIAITSVAQNVLKSDINVRVVSHIPREEILNDSARIAEFDKINLYDYSFKVTQYIDLDNYQGEFLRVYLENMTYLRIFDGMFFKYLEVYGQSINGNKYAIKYNFDGQYLDISLKPGVKSLVLFYEFQPDFLFRISSGASNYFIRCSYAEQSWYFYCQEMIVNSMIFDIQGNKIDLFISPLKSRSDNLYVANTDAICDFGVDFYVVPSCYYENSTLKTHGLNIELHANKGVKTDTITTVENNVCVRKKRNVPANRDVGKLRDSLFAVWPKRIRSLGKLLGCKTIPKTHIVDVSLWRRDESEKKYLWGISQKCNNGLYLICADSALFEGHHILHEIIHTLLDASKYDSNEYFLGESLVEFLAVYYNYQNPNVIDSIFAAKLEEYKQYENLMETHSIFELNNNTVTWDGSGSGTHIIVYQKTPYLIYKMSQKIGTKAFIKFLSKFIKSSQDKNKIDFNDFEKAILHSRLISITEWDEYRKQL